MTRWMADAADAAAGRPMPTLPGFDPSRRRWSCSSSRAASLGRVRAADAAAGDFMSDPALGFSGRRRNSRRSGGLAAAVSDTVSRHCRSRTRAIARGFGAERSAYTRLVLDGRRSTASGLGSRPRCFRKSPDKGSRGNHHTTRSEGFDTAGAPNWPDLWLPAP